VVSDTSAAVATRLINGLITGRKDLAEESIALLTSIPGVDKGVAGTDMRVFNSEKKLAKWTGICPGNNESAGKKADEPPMATNI